MTEGIKENYKALLEDYRKEWIELKEKAYDEAKEKAFTMYHDSKWIEIEKLKQMSVYELGKLLYNDEK